ncbi:hypothetical protein ADP71_27720 [Vitreoscilla sp. C1]|uniref:hypothetical protein n=1 Tax=Vitreoscilla sp. (strain C1) TaxID=96942 RepID=UPI00148E92D8|nr:hypothetical protein [Vitreoscilla sp. C1]AUZ06037.2 hypothetical protein ADP71_27720 [Vitreoscilla sp. C1]
MKKSVLASILGLSLGLASLNAMAFYDTVSLTYDNQPLVIQEVSGRVLGDEKATQAVLVDDILAGQGKKAVPGYRVMFMSRTASVLVESKKNKEGQFADDRMIHRGVKAAFGIPVVDGKMDLNNVKVLNVALISDLNREFKEEDKIRPRGEQLIKKDAKIKNVQLKVTELKMPQPKETSGGGITYQLSFDVDGKKVVSEGNSTFRDWNIAPAAMGDRLFKVDERVIKAQK